VIENLDNDHDMALVNEMVREEKQEAQDGEES
jgi:hypothetical protein